MDSREPEQMVFCCAEQWRNGLFYQMEPFGDGLRLDCDRFSSGFYCTAAVDAGENGFRWDRVLVEADLPEDTALRVYAYAADSRQWGDWINLDDALQNETGDPPSLSPLLQEIFGAPAAESGDFYLECSGRYLWLMFELSATGNQSPVIHTLRLWMRGDHMIDYLPAIYQEDSFTRRFLSIFNSLFADLERDIDNLPGTLDFERADGELLQYLASWVCMEEALPPETLRERIRTALYDYETLYTLTGVRRSIRRLTGRDPILMEYAQIARNRQKSGNPELYRRLYGENPYRFFVLLPEGTFPNQKARRDFQEKMQFFIPAGMSMQTIELKPCIQLDCHTYLGINSQVGGYVPAAINEQVTIHYDTAIGGAKHE